MNLTLLFYVCVDFIAVSLLACADRMITDTKRAVLQSNSFLVDIFGGHRLCFTVSFLVLFLVIALRDHVGTDYNLYARTYLSINSGGGVDTGWVGPLYIALNRLCGLFGPKDYELLFAAAGFLTMFFLYKAIYKMSCCWWLSLYIFICFCFYYQCFNQFRQCLAMSITTYAISFLFDDKTKKFFVAYVIAAGMIHNSAYTVMILYPCCKWPVNKRTMMIYAAVLVGLNVVFTALWRMLPWLLSFTPANYGRYIGGHRDISMDTNSMFNVVVRFSMLAGCLLFAKTTIARNPRSVVWYNCVIINFILTTLTLQSHVLARLTSYFYWPYILLIPEVLKSIKTYLRAPDKRIMALLTVLLFMAYHFVYYFNFRSVLSGYHEYKMMFFSDVM